MKTRRKLLSVLLVVFFIFTSCSTRMIDFTVISSKNVNLKVKDTGKGERVVGTDYVWWFLSIPLGSPNLKEAVDRAIESAGPGYDALLDGVIYSKFYYFLLTAKSGYKVEGTPIKTSELIVQLNQRGEDVDEFLSGVLFHSSLGKDNTAAIKKIGINEVGYRKNDGN
jgi:hypothetical protein